MMGLNYSAALLLLLAFAGAASALECYHCFNMEFPEASKVSFPNLLSNGYCKPKEFDSSALSVTSQQCANETDVCQTIEGTYTYDHPKIGPLDASIHVRRCIKNSEKFEKDGGCIPGKDADAEAHKVDIIPGDPLGDMIGFSGEICTCKDDHCNGSTHLRSSFIYVALFTMIVALVC